MPGLEIRMEVKGLQELSKKMRDLAKTVPGILPKVALLIENQAKINASGRPGPKVQTGRLRASITTELDSGRPPQWARVGTNVQYASFVEFGHAQEVGRFVPVFGMSKLVSGEFKGKYEISQGLGKRLVNPFAPAYPFLQPALEKVKSSGMLDGVFSSFGQGIEKEFYSGSGLTTL